MTILLTNILLLTSCLVVISSAKKSYRGFKVVRSRPSQRAQLQVLIDLQENVELELDFWTEPLLGRDVDIQVPPKNFNAVSNKLIAANLNFTITVQDVQRLIDNEITPVASKPMAFGADYSWLPETQRQLLCKWYRVACGHVPSSTNIVGTYARYGDIGQWLEDMAAKHAQTAQLFNIGLSYLQQKMHLIKIGSRSNVTKPGIWIDAGIHAREWIAPATVIYIVNKMLTEYDTDPDVKYLLDTYDWYIVPVANPDGYENSHIEDRLWRKTMTPQGRCRGVDPNRNFDIDFGGAGSSRDPCSITYAGAQPFSEVETFNIRNAVYHVQDQLKVYLTIHSFSQRIMIPYSYKRNKPTDYAEMFRVANKAADALWRVHGTNFAVGTPPDILYSAAGTSMDWAKVRVGVPYSYTYELRPGAGNSESSFIIPDTNIVPSGEEVWASLVSIAREVPL